MATYNKFQTFVKDLAGGYHDLLDSSLADVLKIALTNTLPDAAADEVFGDITEIAGGNGYTSGGEDTQNSGAEATGTFTLTGTKVVWTATAGGIAQFRYVYLYNDTQTSPAKPLISWWDYGSALDLADGETFTVKFDGGDPDGSIFTLV